MRRYAIDYLAAVGALAIIVAGLWGFCALVLHQPTPSNRIGGGEKIYSASACPNDNATDSQTAAKSPAPVDGVVASSEPRPETAKPTNDCGKPSPTDWTMIWTAATVGFTGLLFVVGSVQAALFVWQLRLIRSSLGDAATAANAAKKSADVAERSMIDLEGPLLYPVIEQNNIWESFASFNVWDHPTSSHNPVRPEIAFRLKNFGRTPALPRTISAVFFYGEPHQAPSDDLAGLFGESFIVPAAASNKEIGRKTCKQIDPDVCRAIMANHGALYLKGSVMFFDIFGHQYEQTFCFRWIPVPGEDSFAAWGPQWNKRRRMINTSGNDY